MRIKVVQHMCGFGLVYSIMLHKHFGICSAKEQLLYCWLEEQGYKGTFYNGSSKCLIAKSDIEDIKSGLN